MFKKKKAIMSLSQINFDKETLNDVEMQILMDYIVEKYKNVKPVNQTVAFNGAGGINASFNGNNENPVKTTWNSKQSIIYKHIAVWNHVTNKFAKIVEYHDTEEKKDKS